MQISQLWAQISALKIQIAKYINTCIHTYIVSLWVKPLVVGGDDGRLYLAISGNAVGLWAEGEQGGGIAGARELELSQVVDEEVQGCGHRAKAALNVPA